MRTLTVIPALNEAKAIGPLVKQIRALGYDVFVIDDGSSDATAELARSAGAVVLSTGKRGGKGNALRQGFYYAIHNNYDAVIAMDGDGQHAPADMHVFVERCRKTGAAIVNGNRMADTREMPAVRRATNAFMSWLISSICGQKIPDTQCGFRLLTADVLRKVTLESDNYEIETEILIKASKQKFKIDSVPITTIYGNEESKIRPVGDTIRFIRYIIRESLRK